MLRQQEGQRLINMLFALYITKKGDCFKALNICGRRASLIPKTNVKFVVRALRVTPCSW